MVTLICCSCCCLFILFVCCLSSGFWAVWVGSAGLGWAGFNWAGSGLSVWAVWPVWAVWAGLPVWACLGLGWAGLGSGHLGWLVWAGFAPSVCLGSRCWAGLGLAKATGQATVCPQGSIWPGHKARLSVCQGLGCLSKVQGLSVHNWPRSFTRLGSTWATKAGLVWVSPTMSFRQAGLTILAVCYWVVWVC